MPIQQWLLQFNHLVYLDFFRLSPILPLWVTAIIFLPMIDVIPVLIWPRRRSHFEALGMNSKRAGTVALATGSVNGE